MDVAATVFDSRALASAAAAERIVAALGRQLGQASRAALIASGGTTPESCFRLLSDARLEWDRVQVVPSDERCVPFDHDASNAGMLQRLLLTGRAESASLVPLYDPALAAGEQCAAFEQRWAELSRPVAICLLGMGEDGHFASLFPDSPDVEQGLDPHAASSSLLLSTPSSSYPRMTLTMPALLECREILLLIFGANKRDVFEQARSSRSRFPVSRLLHEQNGTLKVFWAP